MLIHRSIPSRHSSHRWQHELKRVQWTKQKRLMLVSHREKQVHLLQTNTIESIANEAAFYSCIGAASSNSMQKYETRDQRCLLIPAHLIFHFFHFENKNRVMMSTNFNFNNSNNAIAEEDRLLLEQDTLVFSEATVENETEMLNNEDRDDAVLDGDVRDDAVLDNELKMEVEGIFATSPSASPVTRVESSVVMSPTVLLTPSSSSAPSSVTHVETSLDGVQSPALSRSSSPALSSTPSRRRRAMT